MNPAGRVSVVSNGPVTTILGPDRRPSATSFRSAKARGVPAMTRTVVTPLAR